MDLSLLSVLKTKLVEGKTFAGVLDYFLTNFGEKPEFGAVGKRMQSPFLEELLKQAAGQMFPEQRPIRMAGFLLTHIPEHKFLHGGALLNKGPATLLYFEEVQMGLVAWAPVGPTKFARFSGKALPKGWLTSNN